MNWYKKAFVNTVDDFKSLIEQGVNQICQSSEVAGESRRQQAIRQRLLNRMEELLQDCRVNRNCDGDHEKFEKIWHEISSLASRLIESSSRGGWMFL